VGDVVDRARAASAATAVDVAQATIGQLREPLATELEAIEHPAEASRLAAELEEVRTRLLALTEASATWSVRLDDEFAGLRSRVEFEFHSRLRQIQRSSHDELETLDPAKSWSELSERIQGQVAAAVSEAFQATGRGAADIQAAIATQLADDQVSDAGRDAVAVDVMTLWQDGQAFGGRVRSGVVAGFALLAGATVGMEVLGMLGALLSTALVGPAVIGATLFFGGKEVLEERKRRLVDRRQEARAFVATFIDNVRFEVDGRLAGLTVELQREMRSSFGARIAELIRTAQDGSAALERTLEQTQAELARRGAEVRVLLEELELARERADRLAAD
jgi:hypothetical protein